MDPDLEIKTEIKEELTEAIGAIEMVNCDMAIDETHFEENPLNEEHDSLAITDVQSSNSAPSITQLCSKELLVYTTRLDDMQIWWNNLDAMYVEEVTESIIKESKPKYTGYFENTKPDDQHRRTFSSLKDKIEEINCLPSCRVAGSIHVENDPIPLSKRSKALLRKCKPLYIVLQDCMKNEAYVRVDESAYIPENIDQYPEFTAEVIELTPKVEDDDLSRHIRENMTRNTPYYVILKDTKSEASAIYFVNNDVNPSEYYKLNSKNEQSQYVNPKSTAIQVEIESCCWYKREQRIKELSTAVNFQSMYMKTQHPCAPGLCRCCCKKKSNNGQTSSVYYNPPPIRVPKRAKTSYASSQNSIWQDSLLKRCRGVYKWIDKALQYKAKPQHKNRKKIDNSDISTILQIEHTFVDGVKSSFYCIASPDVSVKTFVEIGGVLTFTEKIVPCYIEQWKSRSLSLACCWCRYNMFLSELTSSYPPSVIKFMRKPHTCAPRKCMCCCKLKVTITEKIPLKLIPIVFPSHLNYASSYCKKLTSQRSSKPIITPHPNLSTCNVVTSCTTTQTTCKVIEPLLVPEVQNTITGNKISTVSKVTERPSMLKTYSRKVTPTNNKIMEHLLLTPPPLTVSKTDGHNITPINSNVINRPITSPAIPQIDSQSKSSDTILNTKLNELKGLSIVLHCDNTVTADLEGTPDKLSTENLKILKMLLQRADMFMKNRKFASAAPMRISNIFSGVKKNVDRVEFPTIVLDDDDDDSPPGGDVSSSSAGSQSKNMPIKPQISQTIPSQQTVSGSQTGSSVTQFQEQFVKNIEKLSSDSTSPANQSEQSAPPIPTQDQYELCTNTLYEKRVQYYNSILSLLNSGNENLSLNLKVPLNKGKDQDLASCIVEFQCFKNRPKISPQFEAAVKRKANDQKVTITEKKIKMDSNVAVSSPINTTQLSQLPFRAITLPSGVNQITNLQGNLPKDSQAITLIPVTFMDPKSGQPIGNIPLSLLSQPITSNATDMIMKPIESAQTVQAMEALRNVVVIPPTPVDNQTQTAPHSVEIPNKNILLSRLLNENTESSIPEPRQMISVESENNIITGIIRNEESNEDVSILGV